MSSESGFWQSLKPGLDKLGIKHWRVEDRTETGFGDLLTLHKGKSVWTELKYIRNPTEAGTFNLTLRKNQPIFLWEWTINGGHSGIAAQVKDMGYFYFQSSPDVAWVKRIQGTLHPDHELVTFKTTDKKEFVQWLINARYT